MLKDGSGCSMSDLSFKRVCLYINELKTQDHAIPNNSARAIQLINIFDVSYMSFP